MVRWFAFTEREMTAIYIIWPFSWFWLRKMFYVDFNYGKLNCLCTRKSIVPKPKKNIYWTCFNNNKNCLLIDRLEVMEKMVCPKCKTTHTEHEFEHTIIFFYHQEVLNINVFFFFGLF